MHWLKQSTASQEVPLGYFLDSTDGNTEETALSIANTDIKIWKTGATTLANKNSGGATHISNGIYYATLDATDTNTLGPMTIFVHVSGALTVKVDCLVLPTNVYDSLIAGTDTLNADVTQWLGTAVATPTTAGVPEVDLTHISGDSSAADNLEADYDGTGYNKSASTIGTCTANTDMRGTDSAYTGTPPTAAAIRSEIDTNSTQLAAIVADTNEVQTDWANGGRLDLLLDAIKAVTDLLPDSGALTSLATAANLATVDTVVGGIQSDLSNATDGLGALKTLIDAVQTTADAIETDTQDIQTRLPAALVGGKMDADATAISGSTTAADGLESAMSGVVTGTAQTGTLSTTQMTTSLSEATDDHYIGRLITFTSGNLSGQQTDITDYSGTNGLLTFTALTEAPANGDAFTIT